jgi:RsiW-degrading membrane proteinase PrsW (M82 family)
MSIGYRTAIAVGAIGLGSILWGLLAPALPQPFAFAAAILPVAVLLAVRERIGGTLQPSAGVGGAAIGVVVALLSHGLVLGFAYLFFLGFADQAVALLESLRIDPELTTVLASPWTILLLAELVLVAPLTEETGKAIGAVLSRPTDRRQAFLAGVTAGTGFAIAENLVYAAFLGVPWNAILLARSLGAAVHPLASGLVMVGWWEWREGRGLSVLARRFLAGAGVHALWNGSLVVLTVTETAFVVGQTAETFAQVSLVYSAALGAILAAGLWRVTGSVAADRERLAPVDLREASTVGAWTVLAASFLVPVAMLLLAFPDFYGG